MRAMRVLYHLALSPFCRKVRVALNEKGLEAALETERVWLRREEFLALNPAGQVPVLVDDEGVVVCDSQAICEYLEEVYPDRRLLGFDPVARAEVRRLIAWFDQKFHQEVTILVLYEKVNKQFAGEGVPASDAIRAGLSNIRYHLDYIGYLTERRRWLAGEEFSLADIAAAAHLSCLDYIGDVPWDAFEPAKNWYMRIKSRPSFRSVLADHVAGLPPPRHYADLDF